jgi:hypothetical protein
MGSMTKFSTLEDYDSRMLCGTSRQPRLADVPVRIPLPAPPIGKTIYEIQKGLRARAFDTVEQ